MAQPAAEARPAIQDAALAMTSRTSEPLSLSTERCLCRPNLNPLIDRLGRPFRRGCLIGQAKASGLYKHARRPHPLTAARPGATHFLMKTLPKVATEMALSVLAYNLTRVMNIVGVKPLIAAMAA